MISIAIHGGAGTISRTQMSEEKEKNYRDALQKSLQAGFNSLIKGSGALDAVEVAVKILEDTPLFNAGKGSVFTSEGTHEMDASIMDGNTLKAGAVAMVKNVKNPVALARLVMEKSEHVFMVGKGAEDFGRTLNCKFEKDDYFFDEFRHKQWLSVKGSDRFQLDHSELDDKKFGTVGAVALDKSGNIAAATSTGGMTNKMFGRIGDSAIIGAGNYANNKTCAVSCTGSGEYFIRSVVAYDVSCLMEYKNYTLAEACKEVIHSRLPGIKGDGGLIAIDAKGNTEMVFNTDGMYRARCNDQGLHEIAIYK